MSNTFTFDKLIHRIKNGTEGHLQLSFEDAVTVQKILVNQGYAVMMSGGDIGDTYKISWIYAGDVGSLDYANSNNIIFCSADLIEMLIFHDYEDDTTI